MRFCIDYRKLHFVTIGQAQPLPRVNDNLGQGDAQYFASLDLKSAYWQISFDEKDGHKTAFVTQRGLFEFNRMPFSLVNAPTTFQRAMDQINWFGRVVLLIKIDNNHRYSIEISILWCNRFSSSVVPDLSRQIASFHDVSYCICVKSSFASRTEILND